MSSNVIGFAGVARCGKGTAAQRLIDVDGYKLVKFAGPLKDMLRAIGLSEREIEGELKESPCELLGGQTPRFAMQTLGAEWGRDTISSDLWIRLWRHRVDQALFDHPGVVVDDVRYPNEADAIGAVGGKLIKIISIRSGVGLAGSHSSEAHDLEAQYTVRNDGTIAEFHAALDRVLNEIARERSAA